MSYVALYRKFRPASFDEVKGQDHIVTTLRNQLRTDRVGHAYLFCGSRGTGKTTVAKILARAVNCEAPTENGPCNECETCRAILEGTSTNVIEIDAASNNGVDNIREIRDEVMYRPTRGRYKVYIIDEVHMLSTGAFNALLKTLEEPPEHVIFILATTEAGKIPVTILSRCQRYDFHRITTDEIAGRVQELLKREGVSAEEKAVRYIARAADGSLRDALSLLEQCVSYNAGQELTYERVLKVLGTADAAVFSSVLRCVLAHDAAGSIRILDGLAQQGKEMGQFVSDFTWYLRNLLLVRASGELEEVVELPEEDMAHLREEAELVDIDALMRYIRVLSELSGTLRTASGRRVLVETALIRLCRPETEAGESALLERIRHLEERLERGDLPAGADPGQTRAAGGNSAPRAAETKAAEPPSAETEKKEAPPPKAAPADLQKVREQWRAIVRETTAGPRNFLELSTPKFDAESEENILYLEVKEELHRMMLDREDVRAELEEIIRRRIGRTVRVQVVIASEAGDRLSEISLDQVVASAVGVPVEEYKEEEQTQEEW